MLSLDDLIESEDVHDRIMGYLMFEYIILQKVDARLLSFDDGVFELNAVYADIHAELCTDTATPVTPLFRSNWGDLS